MIQVLNPFKDRPKITSVAVGDVMKYYRESFRVSEDADAGLSTSSGTSGPSATLTSEESIEEKMRSRRERPPSPRPVQRRLFRSGALDRAGLC